MDNLQLHQIFTLDRPLFVLDTETTGVDAENDRIVELGFQMWMRGGMIKEWRSLIHPGMPIPKSASDVHGITDERFTLCAECARPIKEHEADGHHAFKAFYAFRALAPNLAKGFSGCDYAGKNIRFDLRVLAAEFNRVQQPWSYAGARIVCIDRLEQIAVPRTLNDLHKKYLGSELDGAHGALSDVQGSTRVLVRQLEEHATVLPHSLDALHELCWPNYIDTEGVFRWNGDTPVIMIGKHRGKPMRSVPRDYWQWLAKNGREEVKILAEAAMKGQYPQRKSEVEPPL